MLWIPHPKNKPQQSAYISEADELLYGFAAGGGKTDCEMGLSFTDHLESIIYRREFPQFKKIIRRSIEIAGNERFYNKTDKVWNLVCPDGVRRIVEFGAVQYESDVRKYQGRPHDLICFDELTQFTYSQYITLGAWNRTEVEGQRCRIVCGTNPPLGDELDHVGQWVFEHWAPWLDEEYPNPAVAGELRWFVQTGDEFQEVPDANPVKIHGEDIYPSSRTYIPGTVYDNPYYMKTAYYKKLMALPEPMRSKLLHGDHKTAMEDSPWQVIPREHVKLAVKRWRETERPHGLIERVGVDVSRGGYDKTTVALRVENYYLPIVRQPGILTPNGAAAGNLVADSIGREAIPEIYVDVIGIGASCYDWLVDNDFRAHPLNSSSRSYRMDKTMQYSFVNKRAELWWKFREALDPETGDGIALPPDKELMADLTAVTFKITSGGKIQLEPKDQTKSKLGRSPDAGDAVIYATEVSGVGIVT